jgi:hypothetical protein
MPEEPEPKQHTPKGAEIPVPSKDQVLRDLEKVAKKPKSRDRNGSSEK